MRSIASGLLLLGCARSELELSPSIPQQDSSPPADACSGSCSSSSGSDAASNVDASRAREVTVQLIDYDLEPGADRPVSFNRANGEMYGMATTDSEGKATHVLEDGGSITSLLRVNRQSILYTMTAVDSATKSIVLRLPANTTTLPRLGTLEFELPGPVPGATRYAAHAGCIQTSPVTPLTIQLSKGCLDSAGRASAIVWAYRDALPWPTRSPPTFRSSPMEEWMTSQWLREHRFPRGALILARLRSDSSQTPTSKRPLCTASRGMKTRSIY